MATRKKPAGRYHHGDLRTALLAAAWSVVSKRGIDALSLRAVAEVVGVSNAAPVHHFPTKDALIIALQDEAWRRFADELQASEPTLKALGKTYVRFATSHPEQLRLMFRPAKKPSPHAARAWEALTAATKTPLDAATAWAMVHGLSALLTDAPLPATVDRKALVERALRLVSRGL